MIARYYKAISAFLLAGLGSAATALADGHISSLEWVGIAIAVVGTPVAVGITTNAPSPSVTSALDDRLANVEAQLPTITDISHAVTGGVVAAIQTSHPSSQPPPREPLKAEAKADPPPEGTPDQVFASVADIPTPGA